MTEMYKIKLQLFEKEKVPTYKNIKLFSLTCMNIIRVYFKSTDFNAIKIRKKVLKKYDLMP